MKRYNYKIVRSMWVENFLNNLDGFTNIPMLNYPSQTTEMRAFSGSIGVEQVTAKVPLYFSPHPQIKEFEIGFRELKSGERIALVGRLVLELTNIKIAIQMKCSEAKVRRDFKSSEKKLKKHLDEVNKNKIENLLAETAILYQN